MKLFLAGLLFFLFFGWLVLFFAAIGLFYAATIILSILASLILAFFVLPKISRDMEKKNSKILLLVAGVSLFVSFATCYFSTPTIFGGRDQGSIATAAIYLSQNHGTKVDLPIAHDLFQKYGPGKSLNFPGFDYTKNGSLISRFPLGFTSFLAGAYSLLSLNGIQYANFIPLFFFLVIFWLILSEFFDQKISFLGFLLAATFFPFLWFAKYALTETYMLFLVWSGIYFLITCRRRTSTDLDVRRLRIALAFFGLSSFVRIEGIIFFLLAAAYVFLLQRKKIISLPKKFFKYLLISSMFLFAAYVWLNFPDLADSLKNFVKIFIPNSGKESAPSANLYTYLARIFFNYNLLAYTILGLISIAWLSLRFKKNWPKAEFLPIFVVFPTLFYLISPMISLDEPWLFRRFVFSVFPALIFYAIYTLEKFFRHKSLLEFTLITLIAANSFVSWRFFQTSENKGLLPQIEKFSHKFESEDLILVDPTSTGSGYSLMSEPLRTIFKKNAVYFFNAEDFQYIDREKYKNIYLVAPLMSADPHPWYESLIEGKSAVSAQIINNNFLEPSEKKWAEAVNITIQELTGAWKID